LNPSTLAARRSLLSSADRVHQIISTSVLVLCERGGSEREGEGDTEEPVGGSLLEGGHGRIDILFGEQVDPSRGLQAADS
jgi:hypothetical protein